MEAACIPPVQRKNGLGLTGRGVLIGLVDSGLDLNHPEFLGEDGLSRVAALWDMTAEGTPPEGFLRGPSSPGRRSPPAWPPPWIRRATAPPWPLSPPDAAAWPPARPLPP